MNRRTYLKKKGVIIGGIFFSGTVFTFLEGCKVEEELGWKAKLFSREDADLVRELADIFIPPSDTPGAADLGVEKRIDATLYANYEDEEQHMFLAGLEQIRIHCRKSYQKDLPSLDKKQKYEVMNHLVQDARQNRNPFEKHIYPMLKGLTLIAYFTSEKVAKEVLLYDPVPGAFSGDVAYDEIGGMWSLK